MVSATMAKTTDMSRSRCQQIFDNLSGIVCAKREDNQQAAGSGQ